MNKLLFTTIILLSTNINLFAQTASASASAAIVNSVGAEASGEIKFDYSGKNLQNTVAAKITNAKKNSGKVCTPSSLNILGGSLADDVEIQREPVILKNKNGSQTIKVKISKGLPGSGTINADLVNLPLEALFARNTPQTPGEYSSTFKITVNFN